MSAEPWRKHFWRNTATNYLGVITRIGTGLVLFRLLFQHLSHEQFGYYSLLWSVFGYAILLDFGLGVAVQKAVAEKSATGDQEGLNRLVATVLWSFAVMGVGLFVVAALLKPLFLHCIKINPADYAEFGAAYLVFMGALAVNFPLAMFPEVLRGVQRLDLVNWAIIGSLFVNLAMMAWALLAHWSFPVIVLISVSTIILQEIVTFVIAWRVLPNLSLHPRHFHFPSVRGVMGFSLVAYLITCTNLIILKTDQTVISVSIGVSFVALYQLGYKASEIFSNFSKQLHEALSPAAAHLGASRNVTALRDLFLQTTRITFLITTPLYALCAVYLEPLVRLLSGMKAVDAQTYWVGEMLLLGTYSALLTNGCSKRILVMCGWERPLLKLSLLEAGLNLALSVVLVRTMGIAGVALGTLVPALVVGWFGLIPMAARFVKLNFAALGREVFAPVLTPVLGSLLVLALLVVGRPMPTEPSSLVQAAECAWRGLLVLAPIGALGLPLLRQRRARPVPPPPPWPPPPYPTADAMQTVTEPKTVVLLGVPFHDVTMDETLAVIDEIVRARKPRYIATANLDFAAQANDDVELQRILLDAHLVLCDGKPLVWASRWLDAPLRERVTGSDLTPRLAEHAAQRGYRLFFLGSDQGVLAEAKTRLEAQHPGLKIVGTYAPPYARLHDLNNEEITALVQAAQPDILLVALGAPKQEKWIHMHHRELGVPCSIGIGASLDFVAGKFSRAPVWMQRTGLEWIYRLLQEPRRLFGRYSHDFLFFFLAFYRQKRAMQVFPLAEGETPEIVSRPRGTVIHTWAGRIDAAGISAGDVVEPFPQPGQEYVWLNASEVTFVDSTGLGLLLKAFHKAKAAGGGLIVLRPATSLRQMIVSMKLDRLIPMAEDEEQARALFKTERITQPLKTDFQGEDQRLVCHWSGDLDLAKSKDFATHVRAQWLQSESARLLQVDLSGVRFMDSSGLGSLLQTRKLVGARPGARLELVGLNDNLRNVIRLARLEQMLGVVA